MYNISMLVIEQYVEGKTGKAELCEDGLAANEHFVAAIDGVTNKSSFSFESKGPGRIAMELVREAILSLDPQIDATGALEEINRHIRNWYKDHGLLENMREKNEERCGASYVLFSAFRNELWFVGDCQALINGEAAHPQKLADQIFSDLRALLIHAELAQGKTEEELLQRDTSRERILDLLKLQTKLQNTSHKCEFTYYIVDGFDWDPALGLLVFPVDKPHGEIVLASDGYTRLFPSLKETETFLAKLLLEDPLCYKQLRSTKGRYNNNLSFDDRCYIRFNY
jgi:glycerophosphoryl diester phosphodiesterase